MGLVSHTWSLSIEEQFYLAWPLIVIALAPTRHPRRWMLAACVVGIGWAWVARALLWDGGAGHVRVYMGLDTRADALLVGCALAVILSGRRHVRATRRRWLLDASTVAVAGLAVALTAAAGDYLILPVWLPFATAGLILLAATDASSRLLHSPVMRWVGRRSYALYLWHGLPGHYLHQMEALPALVADVLAIGGSLLLAEVSWRLVESPTQRWFRGRSVRAVETPGLLRRGGREDPAGAEAEVVAARV